MKKKLYLLLPVAVILIIVCYFGIKINSVKTNDIVLINDYGPDNLVAYKIVNHEIKSKKEILMLKYYVSNINDKEQLNEVQGRRYVIRLNDSLFIEVPYDINSDNWILEEGENKYYFTPSKGLRNWLDRNIK